MHSATLLGKRLLSDVSPQVTGGSVSLDDGEAAPMGPPSPRAPGDGDRDAEPVDGDEEAPVGWPLIPLRPCRWQNLINNPEAPIIFSQTHFSRVGLP